LSFLLLQLTVRRRPKPWSCILIINVKNFHGSLTTLVRAQNDTSKTAIITFSILHVNVILALTRLRSHAKMKE